MAVVTAPGSPNTTATTAAAPLAVGPTSPGRMAKPAADPLSGMTGLERVAALLIGLGHDASTEVLKRLREEDIERVTLEIFRMRYVSARVTDAVFEDIYNALLAADYLSTG